MRPVPNRLLSLLAALVAMLLPGPAVAARRALGEESSLSIGLLLQPWLQFIKDGAPLGDVGTDLFLRRIRLIVGDTITERLGISRKVPCVKREKLGIPRTRS